MLLMSSWLGVSIAASAQTCAATRRVPVASPAAHLCAAQGVPSLLAAAVIHTESGGRPYALRINAGRGRSLYPRTRDEAIWLLRVIAPITRNIDIGLFQINVGIWGDRFQVTAEQLLDPATNLAVGCRILQRALRTQGPLWRRIGRYHSGNPGRQRAYAHRVAHWMEHQRRRTP
jgi:soluble lytic murein transglycosylase-like protein